jgi:hypothetical protein
MIFHSRIGRLVLGGTLVAGFFTVLSAASPGNTACAQEYASKERTRAAVGYYSRARAMCVETLQEFEQGRKYARPDLLVDPEEWRLTLITLCEQLNPLIDPKPLVTRDGVAFRANPRMIRRDRDRLPSVIDGAQDSNIYGEQERLNELQRARAKMYEPKKGKVQSEEEAIPPKKGKAAKQKGKANITSESAKAEEKARLDSEVDRVKGAGEQVGQEDEDETPPAEVAHEQTPKTETSAEAAKSTVDDEKASAAIENLVRERLKGLEGGAGQKEEPKANAPAENNKDNGKEEAAPDEDFE